MSNIFVIFKKELYRVLSDRRLVITTIILPGFAIYLLYSSMGFSLQNQKDGLLQQEYVIHMVNAPSDMQEELSSDEVISYAIYSSDLTELSDSQDLVISTDVDLIIVFEENFTTRLNDYQNTDYVLPNIDIYYNPDNEDSTFAFQMLQQYIEEYIHEIAIDESRFGPTYDMVTYNINNESNPYQLFDKKISVGKGLAKLLPMLVILLLFRGVTSIGPDSIAGEKERGTIASLLMTPVKRSDIAIGKVLSLSVISLFSALSSFIGIMLSLPKVISSNIELNYPIYTLYSLTDYFMLFSVILFSVLFMVCIVSVISAMSKSVKEASSALVPLYFVTIFIGFQSISGINTFDSFQANIIPLLNSTNMMISILSFQATWTEFMICISSLFMYSLVLLWVLNRQFESEKIVFSS